MRRDLFTSLILLLFVCHPCPVLADNSAAAVGNDGAVLQGDDIPLLDPNQEAKLDVVQHEASVMLLNAADWVDSFFDDDRSMAENNQTRARASLSVGYSKKDEFEVKPRFDLRLKLPKLAKNANLLIGASDDEEFNIENTPLAGKDEESDRSGDFTAAIRVFLQEAENYNISTDGGASWDYLYAGMRFRYSHELGQWQGRFTDRLRYYTDDGWENNVGYDLERNLSENWLFRSTTSMVSGEEASGIPHGQNFRLFHVISPYQAISYDAGIYMDTEPSYRMSDLQFKVRYRQRFFRDWLVLEVSPRCSFPEDYDYEFNPGIIVKLEATIGYNTDTAIYKKIFN